MNKIITVFTIVFIISMFGMAIAETDDAIPIPISAEQAFDAYAEQKDPLSGKDAKVAIVDVRTASEYYWVGTCAQVTKIIKTNGDEIIPYNGKVVLLGRIGYLKFKVRKNGRTKFIPVKYVEEIETTPIAINIPYKTWNDETATKPFNDYFSEEIEALAGEYDVIIMMCRSGKRSSLPSDASKFNFNLFNAVYEIDQPDGTNARGGFQGTSYSDSYNGYRGYPGRRTYYKEHNSVSWSDAGLPCHIGWEPQQ